MVMTQRARPLRLPWRILEALGPVAALLALTVLLAALCPDFRTVRNATSVAAQTANIAVMAIGQTFVIIGGGIDLSVGSVLALAGVAAALAMTAGLGVPAGIAVGVVTAGLCGLINGLLVTRVRLAPFIVTLGMMGICRGAALQLTGAQPVFDLPPSFGWLGVGTVAGIPVRALVMVLVAVGASLVLSRTRFGRHTFAIGGNREAARLAGIPVARHVTVLFVVCGLLTGLAGVMESAQTGTGQPTAGEGYELDAIAAAVIGGTSLMGGEGSVFGSVVGAFIMAVLRNGFNLLDVSVHWRLIAIGGMIVLAATVDRLRRGTRTQS
jgi:ribose transport system permease protein